MKLLNLLLTLPYTPEPTSDIQATKASVRRDSAEPAVVQDADREIAKRSSVQSDTGGSEQKGTDDRSPHHATHESIDGREPSVRSIATEQQRVAKNQIDRAAQLPVKGRKPVEQQPQGANS